MAIEFPVSVETNIATVKIEEELQSVEACVRLKEAIKKASTAEATTVILDVSEVNSLSSYSLGRLMKTQAELRDSSVVLKLTGVKPTLQVIFSELNIGDLFPNA